MHAAARLGSFMALRANGWSLARISKELNIAKSTLWEWDNKNQNEIHLLKHLQLEKLQERYLPTYEEELSKLRSYLDRLEAALETQDFSKMGPEYVLQMALQLRARLGKMREQVPLRTIRLNEPAEPLPFTGCVSRQDANSFREEFFAGEPVEDDPEVGRSVPAEPSCNVTAPQASAQSQPTDAGQPANDNKPVTADNRPEIPASPDSENVNRTFPDETPPRLKHRPLYHNDFRYRDPERRPILHSENVNGNRHDNGNGDHHLNGNGHPRGKGNGHHNSEERTET